MPVYALFRASILDFRAKLANRCMLFPVCTLLRASILDFKPKLANRCKVFPDCTLLRASILDFKPRLANRCKLFPVYPLFRASILDFKPRLGNRCKLFPVYPLFRASILDFRAKLENRCKVSPFTPSCVHRFLISGSNLGIDAAPSLLHRRMACLQRSRGVQAGTGCHEGGIILCKKPPEWRLSPPYQRSASESNLLCGKVEWFRLPQSSRQRRIARLP